jgi:hypothetical protein
MMSDDERLAALHRILIDLTDVLMAEHSGKAGNWGYPFTFDALANIKSNLMSLKASPADEVDSVFGEEAIRLIHGPHS